MPRIDFAAACQKCATQLCGMDVDGTCPTCGRPIGETVDDRIIDLSSGMVAVDLACAECTYNLRTLKFNAACPECGTPVSKSLGVEELRFCDPRWLGKVRRGITIVLVSVLASIVVGFLAGIVVAFAGLRGAPPTSLSWFFMLPTLILYVLMIIGAFYITSPKVDESTGERINRIGRLTRGLLIASLTLSVVGMIFIDPFAALTGGAISGWNFSLAVVQSILYGGAFIGALIVLSRIAVLGRRRGLRKLGTVLVWLVGFYVLGQVATNIYTFRAWPTIAASLPASPFATTTSTTVGAGGSTVATTITVSGNAPATQTGSTGSNPSTAPGATVAPPAALVLPTRTFAGFAVFGCFSGVVTLGAFVLGLITLVKYRNLLSSAITASVASARLQMPLQGGPVE